MPRFGSLSRYEALVFGPAYDAFGVDAVYQGRAVGAGPAPAPRVIRVIDRTQGQTLTLPTGAVIVSEPSFAARRGDIPADPVGDVLVVGTTRWRIRSWQAANATGDATGEVSLIVSEEPPEEDDDA
jgi:hypothetical protein